MLRNMNTLNGVSTYKIVSENANAKAIDELGNALLRQEIDGFVLNDFVSAEEARAVVRGFRSLQADAIITINKGFLSYPESFAQFTQGIEQGKFTEEHYYKKALEFRKQFEQNFGMDIEQKCKNLFERLFVRKNIEVPVDKYKTGSFMPFNFRELKPDFGELTIHCENIFFDEFPRFFELLSHTVLRKNDFSFFITLQQPEEGGELCLFSHRWNEAETRFQKVGDTNNYVQELLASNPQEQLISPPVGSIVVFSGGDIWHRVNVVKGDKSRITIGGFVSSGVEENMLYIWA
ncbi:MAG: 2OG-Fe(II) oxygenase [Chitinophagales bacterium]|nr:2OG-Fe(II) oxygenase [Chitinophagales bacterium]